MARPRIGWLTYGVERPLSGVTRYALELGRALGRRNDVALTYLTPYRRGPFIDETGCRAVPLPGCGRLPSFMTLGALAIAVAARRLGLDVVHDPVGVAPFLLPRRVAPFRRVVTVHDAIAYRFPAGYPWLNNAIQRQYLPAVATNLDAAITVGQHAATELAKFLPQLPVCRQTAPPAISDVFRPLAARDRRPVLERLGLRRPYILSVGARQERKNLRRLIAVFAHLHGAFPDYQLALAGPTLWRIPSFRDQIAAAGLDNHVVQLGYVPEADLPALYGGAALFALLSLYEGFGIPILEAMACGTPVVCANTTALPETADGAALLVDPRDSAAIAEGMARLLRDAPLADDLRRRGRQRAARATWDASASATVAAYGELIAAPPR